MPKLFLAEIQIRTYKYMGDDMVSGAHRLVWADSEEEAEAKVRLKLEKDDPYGESVTLDYVAVTEAIE